MSLDERTGIRDLTFSRWHRTHPLLGDGASAIDLDLVGYCGICLAPHYVVEATRSEAKSTSVLAAVADRLGVPGILVRYHARPDGSTRFVGYSTEIVDGRRRLLAVDDDLAALLSDLRATHRCGVPA